MIKGAQFSPCRRYRYTLTRRWDGVWADGPRYKALGNSMAVPVMHWIGKRINAIAAIQREREGK